MQKRPAESNYDKVLKILSLLEYSKPVALATISRRTEIKLGEVISFAKMLEEEKIIERGTHQALLSEHGYYWKLYCLQFEGGEKQTSET